MKIVNYVLTFLMTSSVFADDYFDTEEFKLDQTCIQQFLPYRHCFDNFEDEYSVASACEIAKNDGCYRYFLRSKENVFPNVCYEAEKLGLRYELLDNHDYYQSMMQMFCQFTNNEGKTCEAVEFYFKFGTVTKSELYEIIDRNCENSNCNKVLIKYLQQEYKTNNYDEIKQSLYEIFQYIQSDKCTSKYKDISSTKASTTTKKASTTTKKALTTTTKASSVKASVISKISTTTLKASNNNKTSTTTKVSNTKVSISTVENRCGSAFGGRCANANYCCSKYNYCGTTDEYCGNGCQSEFGICNTNKQNTNVSNVRTTSNTSSTSTNNKISSV